MQKYHVPSCSSAGSRQVFPHPTSQHFPLPEQSASLEHFVAQVSVGFTVGHRPGFACVGLTNDYKMNDEVIRLHNANTIIVKTYTDNTDNTDTDILEFSKVYNNARRKPNVVVTLDHSGHCCVRRNGDVISTLFLCHPPNIQETSVNRCFFNVESTSFCPLGKS